MSGFDRLERELEAAAERPRRGLPPRNAGGAVVIAAGVAAVVVVAVAAVVLLHGHTASTRAGTSVPAQPAPQAQATAWVRLLKCPPHRSLPTTSAAPERALVAAVGVLRAPWSTADAVPSAAHCGKNTPYLITPGKIDIRYVRYVGPGVDGGEVFLAPAVFVFKLPPALKHLHPHLVLPVPSRIVEACLFTIGASAAQSVLDVPDDCTPLSQIERPAGETFAPPSTVRIPRRAVQGACSLMPRAMRKKCLLNGRKAFILPPQIISGVVRDGIVSLDVYARVKGARKLVLDLPIQNNAYSFKTGGVVTGKLTLVFKDGAGNTVRTGPSDTGVVNTVNTVSGAVTGTARTITGYVTGVNRGVGGQGRATIPLISPPLSSASPHTAVPRRR